MGSHTSSIGLTESNQVFELKCILEYRIAYSSIGHPERIQTFQLTSILQVQEAILQYRSYREHSHLYNYCILEYRITYSSIGLSKILNIIPVFVYFKYGNGYSSLKVLNLKVFSQTVPYSSICLHTRVQKLSLKEQVTMFCLWKLHTSSVGLYTPEQT